MPNSDLPNPLLSSAASGESSKEATTNPSDPGPVWSLRADGTRAFTELEPTQDLNREFGGDYSETCGLLEGMGTGPLGLKTNNSPEGKTPAQGSGDGPLKLFSQDWSDIVSEDESECDEEVVEDWMTWNMNSMEALYSTDEVQLTQLTPMRAVVFHEHLGFKKLWNAELELIRVIMEQEPPEGEDFRAALDGRISYWRWRDWVVCMGTEDTFRNRGMLDSLLLMNNMAPFNLPESFSQVPTPLMETIGEGLHRRAWGSFDRKLISEETSSDGEMTDSNSVNSTDSETKKRRTNLHLSSPTRERVYDGRLELVTSASEEDGVFKLDVRFDTSVPLSKDPVLRMEDLVRASRIRVSMWKRRNGRILTRPPRIDLALEHGDMGFHELTEGRELSVRDLATMARKQEVIIAVKEKFGLIAYSLSSNPLKKLLSKLSYNLQQMCLELDSWVARSFESKNIDFLGCSLDLLTESKHVLVGNIPLDTIRGPLGPDTMRKIQVAIQSASPGAKISKNTLDRLSGNDKYHMTAADLGVKGFSGGKVSIVVELERPILVGVGMNGGIPILTRPLVETLNPGKGEYFLKQFLSETEASLLRGRETPALERPMNTIACFRQNNTLPGLQDLLRRCIKETLTKLLGIEVVCLPVSGKHRWDGTDEVREETLLVALSPFNGGEALLRDVLGIDKEVPSFKLWVGSAEVQGHFSGETIINAPFMESDQLLNIRRKQMEKGADLMAVHASMHTVSKSIVALMKEPIPGSHAFEMWTAVLDTPRIRGVAASIYGDRPAEGRRQWKGKYPIITWKGSDVTKMESILLAEVGEPDEPAEEQFEDVKRRSRKKKAQNSSGGSGSESDAKVPPQRSNRPPPTERTTEKVSLLKKKTSGGSSSDSNSSTPTTKSDSTPTPLSKSRPKKNQRSSDSESSSPNEATTRKAPDPPVSDQSDGEKSNKVMIRNIDWTASTEELMTHMSAAGQIIQGTIYSLEGRSQGRGWVEYAENEYAVTAITVLNGQEMRGRPLLVTPFVERRVSDRDKRSPPPILAPSKSPEVGPPSADITYSGLTVAQASKFRESLDSRGLEISPVLGDGWCLFHAVALVIGREGQGKRIMEEAIDEMKRNPDEYRGAVSDNDLDRHVRGLRNYGWADEPELGAMRALFGRSFEIWTPDEDGKAVPRNNLYAESENSIKLVYFPGRHYDALVPTGASLTRPSKPAGAMGGPNEHNKKSSVPSLAPGMREGMASNVRK